MLECTAPWVGRGAGRVTSRKRALVLPIRVFPSGFLLLSMHFGGKWHYDKEVV